jgi:hypothetical protein
MDDERQPGPDGGGGIPGAVAAWVGWFVTCAVLWLWLVDTVVGPELVVGAGVAVVGASAALVVRQQRRVVLRPPVWWLLRLWRPLAAFPRDMWLLVVALPRRRRGRFVAVPAADVGDDPRGAAQRVLMQTAASFAPNTYVIGTDLERGFDLIHELVDRGTVERDTDPLRLR